MTILCGTDFSENARGALRAAVAWARRTGDSVELVHAIDLHGAFALLPRSEGALLTIDDELARWRTQAEVRLAAEAASQSDTRVQLHAEIAEGASDAALVAAAERVRAKLIVVAALGTRAGSAFTLGSTADRVAQQARCPVLVVRDPGAIEAWSAGRATLAVSVGVDASSPSDAAVRWCADLARQGGVALSAVHVYWPPEAREKLGTTGGLQLGSGHRAIESELERELGRRLARFPGAESVPLALVGGLGRVADHVVHAAETQHANLVVVGSNQRGGLLRFWHGSVSHGVISRARTNVAVVPEGL